MKKYNFKIPLELSGLRADKALAVFCDSVSRSQIQKAIKKGCFQLNEVIITDLSVPVKENDVAEITIEEENNSNLVPTNIPLNIVYEDEELIVINKSSDMTVHPGAGNHSDTLVNALLHHSHNLSDIGGEIRPGIVHRLDKNTSGLMVVAKNNNAHRNLANQIATRTLQRKYKALVWGIIKPNNGMIDQNITRSDSDRTKMTTVRFGGREAITHYKTIEILQNGLFSLVECKLDTGRTHQIRVHLSHLGHSIVGDQTYGNNKRKILGCSKAIQEQLLNFNHQALHSFYIGLEHPTTKQFMEFTCDLPTDFAKLMGFLAG